MSISPKLLLQYQKQFGANLRKIRLDKGLSQNDLAAICDLDKTAISRLENGRSNATIRTIFELSLGLDTPPSEFLADLYPIR